MNTWECSVKGCGYTTKQPVGVLGVTHTVRGTEHALRRRKETDDKAASPRS